MKRFYRSKNGFIRQCMDPMNGHLYIYDIITFLLHNLHQALKFQSLFTYYIKKNYKCMFIKLLFNNIIMIDKNDKNKVNLL